MIFLISLSSPRSLSAVWTISFSDTGFQSSITQNSCSNSKCLSFLGPKGHGQVSVLGSRSGSRHWATFWEFPGEIWNCPLGGGQGKTEREAGHSKLVGGRFNSKGTRLEVFILGGHKTRISVPVCQNLKSLYRDLHWVLSCIQSRYSEHHTSIARLYPWSSFWEEGRQTEHTLLGQGKGWEPPVAQLQLYHMILAWRAPVDWDIYLVTVWESTPSSLL